MKRSLLITVVALVMLCASVSFAQQTNQPPDRTIDAATRTQVIDAILTKLNETYVFPEVAKNMEKSVRERATKGEYDKVTSARSFAERLTSDLQEVSRTSICACATHMSRFPSANRGASQLPQSAKSHGASSTG